MDRAYWSDKIDTDTAVFMMIGNGFDLECGLPTSYGDFMRFLSVVETIKNDPRDLYKAKKVVKEKLNPSIQKHVIESLNGFKFQEFWIPLIDNHWYHHFKNAHINRKWIDFEAEISKVIQIVENNMIESRNRHVTLDDFIIDSEVSELSSIFPDLFGFGRSRNKIYDKSGSMHLEYEMTYRNIRDLLLIDLNALIKGFEKYLYEYVERVESEPTVNIQILMDQLVKTDKRYVLTYNYTTTFERMLERAGITAKYCYVHGKVGDGEHRNRMVLGIDEHLDEQEVKKLVGFAPFRKYNQRIIKGTDSNYMDWLENIKVREDLDNMLFIFGHSLGITDKDIIQKFVCANNMQTIIYYHSDDAFSEQVSNLTAIISMHEVIYRTGGKMHSLEFRKQK